MRDLWRSGPQRPSDGTFSEKVLALTSTFVINQSAFTNACGLPLGAVVNCVPAAPPEATTSRQPVPCSNCSAFVNPYCKVQLNGAWSCNFCGTTNPQIAEYATTELRLVPELSHEAVDYMLGRPDQPARNDIASSDGGNSPAPQVLALLIDATLDASIQENLRRALDQVLADLPSTTSILLMTFDGVVSVWELGGSGAAASAHVLPGSIVAEAALIGRLLRSGGPWIAPLATCRTALDTALASLRPYQEDCGQRRRRRCMGAAVDAAVHIVSALQAPAPGDPEHQLRHCRLLLFAGGPSTLGPGSVPLQVLDLDEDDPPGKEGAFQLQEAQAFWRQMGDIAGELGMQVDLFACSPGALSSRLHTPLTSPGGGCVVLHEGFGTMFGSNLRGALRRRFGTRAIIDVRVSQGLQVTQIMGPFTAPLHDPLDESPSPPEPLGPGLPMPSANACLARSLDEGNGFGVMLELAKDIPAGAAAAIQVVMRWTASDNSLRLRVVTRRLRVVDNIKQFLRGVDAAAAAVLIAKKASLDAYRTRAALRADKAEDARTALGGLLGHLAHRFGRHVKTAGGFLGIGARQYWSIPPQLAPVAHMLYNLQRSTLLAATPGGSEERLLLSHLLQIGSMQSTLPLLLPALHQLDSPTEAGGGDHEDDMEPSSLSLMMCTHALVDLGHSAVLWHAVPPGLNGPTGSTPEDVEALCLRYMADQGRFPLPAVREVRAPEHEAVNSVMPLLNPMHMDALQDALHQCPQLAMLAAHQLQQLQLAAATAAGKAAGSSFYQWCRTYGVEPPQPQAPEPPVPEQPEQPPSRQVAPPFTYDPPQPPQGLLPAAPPMSSPQQAAPPSTYDPPPPPQGLLPGASPMSPPQQRAPPSMEPSPVHQPPAFYQPSPATSHASPQPSPQGYPQHPYGSPAHAQQLPLSYHSPPSPAQPLQQPSHDAMWSRQAYGQAFPSPSTPPQVMTMPQQQGQYAAQPQGQLGFQGSPALAHPPAYQSPPFQQQGYQSPPVQQQQQPRSPFA